MSKRIDDINNALSKRIDEVNNRTTGMGNLFRFTEDQYIYNLSTRNLQTGTYLATVTLDDGEKYTISIGIK